MDGKKAAVGGLALVAVAVAGAVVWFLASPLFLDRAVDETFPEVATAMDDTQRAEAMAQHMAEARAMPDKEMAEAMPDAPVLLRSGVFRDVDAVHTGSGKALLYQLADGRHIVRFEDFRVANGPDLVVLLARHPDPGTAADVTDGGYVDLGLLKGNVGSQNYVLPDDSNPAEYGSVVIWCRLFGVLFSPAALEAA